MNNSHNSFLASFFKQMNAKFQDIWCLLHSCETLPFYSVSDIARSVSNIDSLELLIQRILKQRFTEADEAYLAAQNTSADHKKVNLIRAHGLEKMAL